MPISRPDLLNALAAANNHREVAARLLGVSRRTVCRAMAQYRIDAPRSGAVVTPELAERMTRTGGTIPELARHFQVSQSTAWRVCAGVTKWKVKP